MRLVSALAVAAATLFAPGAVQTVAAQEQVTESLTCRSNLGQRASCPVNGEIVSAGLQRRLGEGTPCFLNYTWGFEENGLWTANGCSAEFVVTVERATPQRVVDPEVLRERLREARRDRRQLRRELTAEQEARAALEVELAEAQQALRDLEAGRQNADRRPQPAVRAVAQCSNRAIRDAGKFGADKARIVEIVSARATQGTWLVIGRMMTEINGDRTVDYFRCWSEKDRILDFQNAI